MAWQCVLYEIHPDVDLFRLVGSSGDWAGFKSLPVGAMYIDWEGDLCVKLPGGGEWNIDRADRKWTRTGTPPNVTVNPSINHLEVYHGWLRDGVLTDDCEGRRFDDA